MALFRRRQQSDEPDPGAADEQAGADEAPRAWAPGQPIAPREAPSGPGQGRRRLPGPDEEAVGARPGGRLPLPQPGRRPRLAPGQSSQPPPAAPPATPSDPPAPPDQPAPLPPARPTIAAAPSFRPRLAPDAPAAAGPERLPVPGQDIVSPTLQAADEPPPGYYQSQELTIDDVGVTARRRAGLVEQVTWEGLLEVAIRTVRTGVEGAPRGQFWLLGARNGSGVVVPAEGAASDALLQRLQRLPTFDNRLVAKGLTEPGDRLTVVWRER